MICDLCGAPFEATPENPGVTTIACDDRNEQVARVCLCHACVTAFHALPPPDQQAQVAAIHAAADAR